MINWGRQRTFRQWWEDTWRVMLAKVLGPKWCFPKPAWRAFCQFLAAWMEGWKDVDVEQPNRLELLSNFGKSPHTWQILRSLYRLGSLQRAVMLVLHISKEEAQEVSATIVQVSHSCFPDIAGTYDHSSRWRRKWN